MNRYWAIEHMNEALGSRVRRHLSARTKDEALSWVKAEASNMRRFVVIELIDLGAAGAHRVVCSVRGER